MNDEHDKHGQSPAAWTAVSIVMLAFVIGLVGVIMGSSLIFWIAVGVAILGAVVGRVMAMMGMGVNPKST